MQVVILSAMNKDLHWKIYSPPSDDRYLTDFYKTFFCCLFYLTVIQGSLTLDEETTKAASDKTAEAASVLDNPAGMSQETELEHCFLAALKHRVTKKGQLPLDIGEFYSRYLLPCVPSDRHIDMKKTIYKKFVVFLERINENESGPIVKIAMKQKGSEVITEVCVLIIF
ncbi:unnamed protein product [Gongylonema pulchrum]|uniref:RGS domain-containing protein n=1 Tax=Gongylonema pulchrum TaxID=637853 RepID=A0A183EED8_9BILA|nr:unnamed protein product [Gongylonema pulchrum]